MERRRRLRYELRNAGREIWERGGASGAESVRSGRSTVMRAYIHAFQGKPWNEECQAAYDGFTGLGIECVLFTTNEELARRSREDIVVGGMLIMHHSLTELGIQPLDYNYPEELHEYLGRNIRKVRLENVLKERLPVFIKPFEEKAAKGTIVNSREDFAEYRYMDRDAIVFCSDVVHFQSEWRCFVRYKKILGIQHYAGDSQKTPDQELMESAVRKYKEIPAGCSLDFGVTDDGKTLLIEMNDGFAIGCYGLDPVRYAKMLYARWAELTGVEDCFR